MMYILRQSDKVVQGKTSGYSQQYAWNIGGKKPRQEDGNCFNDVCEVYADGKELETVRRRCTNIPDVPSQGSMVWKPPFAQFIYDSLIYEPANVVPTGGVPMLLPPRPAKR